MSTTVAAINREFLERVSSAEGISKVAQEAQDVLNTKVYEDSFTEAIMPSKPITVGECYVDQEVDIIYRQEWIDVEAVAFEMDMNAEPTGKYLQGQRYIVPFSKFGTPRYWKTEQEIRVYPYPITDYMEKHGAAEVVKQRDAKFLRLCDLAVAATTNVVPGVSTLVPTREDIVNLVNLIAVNELEPKKLLLHQTDFNRFLQWNSIDLDQKAAETAVDGWVSHKLLGYEFITTIKADVITPGRIYAFTDPKFIGKHYVLNELKFELEKRFDKIQFQLTLEAGMNFGHLFGIARLDIPQT